MAVIGKKKKRATPEVSTSSLPDIIFTLLFFFMVSAKVKDSSLKVGYTTPKAVEVKKLSSSDKVSTIHVGSPLPAYSRLYGSEPRIQLNKQISEVEDIQNWARQSVTELPYQFRPKFMVNIKADENVPTRMMTEIKDELRKAEALRINYDSKPLSYE